MCSSPEIGMRRGQPPKLLPRIGEIALMLRAHAPACQPGRRSPETRKALPRAGPERRDPRLARVAAETRARKSVIRTGANRIMGQV